MIDFSHYSGQKKSLIELDIEQIAEEYLLLAENIFGPSVSEWSYGGIEFNENGPNLRLYLMDSAPLKAWYLERSRRWVDKKNQF